MIFKLPTMFKRREFGTSIIEITQFKPKPPVVEAKVDKAEDWVWSLHQKVDIFSWVGSGYNWIKVEPTGAWKIEKKYKGEATLYLEIFTKVAKEWVPDHKLSMRAEDKITINQCGCGL